METNNQRIKPLLIAGAGLSAGFFLLRNVLHKQERLQVRGQVVVITGASRGLGLSLAEEFGRAGAKLVLAARNQDELKAATNLLGERGVAIDAGHLDIFAGDLRQEQTCQDLIAFATRRFGRVDILINNAGVIFVGPVEKQPTTAYRDAMDSDFFATVQLVNAVLPQMLERQHGSIVNITSIGGKLPVPHLAPYNAAKFAAVGYSGTLHAELKMKGVHVTTVCPGLMRTGSYPNSLVVGDLEKEYRWFSLSASLPGLASSAQSSARKILNATIARRAELTIGFDAYLAARAYGLMPETVIGIAGLADRFLLPSTAGDSVPTSAKRIRGPQSRWWQSYSRRLTQSQNQPAA